MVVGSIPELVDIMGPPMIGCATAVGAQDRVDGVARVVPTDVARSTEEIAVVGGSDPKPSEYQPVIEM